MAIIQPAQPFPNLLKYDWDQPELITWFHHLSFIVDNLGKVINTVATGGSDTPVSVISASEIGLSDSEGLGQFSVPSSGSIDINNITFLLQQALSRGLIGNPVAPIHLSEESDFPLTPICCL